MELMTEEGKARFRALTARLEEAKRKAHERDALAARLAACEANANRVVEMATGELLDALERLAACEAERDALRAELGRLTDHHNETARIWTARLAELRAAPPPAPAEEAGR